MANESTHDTLTFEEVWPVLQEAINKLIDTTHDTLTFEEVWPVLQEAINKLIDTTHDTLTFEERSPVLQEPINKLIDTTHDTLTFEEGWPVLQEAINKLIDSVEGVRSPPFTSEEYMTLYTTVFNICTSNRDDSECQKVYDGYKKAFEDYISSKVLPSLWEKKDENINLLQELVKRWNNHKFMTTWLSKFFRYLGRYFIPRRELPTLHATSHLIFYKLVYGNLNDTVRDSVMSMIDREREGEQIDQALVKNVLDIYVEMREGSMKYYKKDFEETMLKNTTAFYSQKASIWIASESPKDYLLKVEGCLKQERERVSCYLQQRRQHKLLQVVEHELLSVYASKLEEKNTA